MHVPWRGRSCILCLIPFADEGVKARSRAHVIAESVGGKLTTDCLCAECNSHIGDTWERYLPLDPAIRLAIEELAPSFPGLSRGRTAPGRRFIGKTEEGVVRVKALPEGDYRLLPTTLPSGVRIQDAGDAAREIRRRLEKVNADENLIEEALAHLEAGGRVRLQDDIYVVTEGEVRVGLPHDEPLAPPEAFLAMGFLYLALNAEDAIYPAQDGTDAFAEVRSALLGEAPTNIETAWGSRSPETSWQVDMRRAESVYEAAHMIGLESTDPPLVRVRLFRMLVWDVRLPSVSRKLDRAHYIVELDPPSEGGFVLED